MQLLLQRRRPLHRHGCVAIAVPEFRAEYDLLLAGSVAESLVPPSREFRVLVSDLRGFTPMTELYPPARDSRTAESLFPGHGEHH
jgi:hypothetical protein